MPMLTNLDAHYYVDPDVFEAERQRIFKRHWQMLGPAARLRGPGDYLAVDVAGWKLFALRGRDGVLRGFHNVCRHRGARLLAEGAGNCRQLRCPYHQWVYDETGALRQAPWFGDDADFKIEDWPLAPAHIAEWRGLLFLGIEPDAALLDQLGDLPEEIADSPIETYAAVEEHRFTMRSNWKTYTDNFVEGYHIPGIHPGFMKVIEFAKFETVAQNGMVRMTAPQRNGSIYGGKWLWMWPNWTLSVFPGGMNTSRINPLAVNTTELIYDFYFSDTGEESAPSRRSTIDVNCGIVREDFGICEHTQNNYVSGGYSPGPLSPRHEQSVAYFQTMVKAALDSRPSKTIVDLD
ncbi:MAG: aromatic ring-hydroxylating dioxygenase subunit alpha [Steroidobacteraceae bacterium]|jgi:phenylpropionate dioxygenase-like ring-hydroxylating dioxygenase large terminal subunit